MDFNKYTKSAKNIIGHTYTSKLLIALNLFSTFYCMKEGYTLRAIGHLTVLAMQAYSYLMFSEFATINSLVIVADVAIISSKHLFAVVNKHLNLYR